jgi:hypothetical protein
MGVTLKDGPLQREKIQVFCQLDNVQYIMHSITGFCTNFANCSLCKKYALNSFRGHIKMEGDRKFEEKQLI